MFFVWTINHVLSNHFIIMWGFHSPKEIFQTGLTSSLVTGMLKISWISISKYFILFWMMDLYIYGLLKSPRIINTTDCRLFAFSLLFVFLVVPAFPPDARSTNTSPSKYSDIILFLLTLIFNINFFIIGGFVRTVVHYETFRHAWSHFILSKPLVVMTKLRLGETVDHRGIYHRPVIHGDLSGA